MSVYFIFMAWDIVGFCVIYIFAVETKQVSLLHQPIQLSIVSDSSARSGGDVRRIRSAKPKEAKLRARSGCTRASARSTEPCLSGLLIIRGFQEARDVIVFMGFGDGRIGEQ